MNFIYVDWFFVQQNEEINTKKIIAVKPILRTHDSCQLVEWFLK